MIHRGSHQTIPRWIKTHLGFRFSIAIDSLPPPMQGEHVEVTQKNGLLDIVFYVKDTEPYRTLESVGFLLSANKKTYFRKSIPLLNGTKEAVLQNEQNPYPESFFESPLKQKQG